MPYACGQCFVCEREVFSAAEIVPGSPALCWACVAALWGGMHFTGRATPRTDIPQPNAHFVMGASGITTTGGWFIPEDRKGKVE